MVLTGGVDTVGGRGAAGGHGSEVYVPAGLGCGARFYLVHLSERCCEDGFTGY